MTASSTVLLFRLSYCTSRQNVIILFWKYLVDIKSEAWLNLFGKYINGKLFAMGTIVPNSCSPRPNKKLRLLSNTTEDSISQKD